MTTRYALPLALSTGPWTALAQDSGAVIGLRLWRVSLLWWTDPAAAEREMRLMVSEKQAAASETVMALAQSPWTFWMDAARGWPTLIGQADLDRAWARSHKRLAAPSSRRVKANRRRLGR